MTRMAMIILAVLLTASSHAQAHDKAAHGRPAAHGTVASVSGDQLTLTTDTGEISVTLMDTTKIERAGQEVGRDTLVSGVPVAVFGTKVPQQGLVAREVVVEASETTTEPHGDHQSGH